MEHQKEVITRRTRYELGKTEERAHVIAGLVLALANVDEVIRIIKASADKNAAVVGLTSAFELDEKQANAILEMRLQRLTSLEVEKLKEELETLYKTIDDLKDILANEYRVLEIIRKHSSRRTETVTGMIGEAMTSTVVPTQVVVGGATVFVTNVELFEKM